MGDPFLDGVTDFILKTLGSQGARDRIELRNNRNHNLYVHCFPEYISISYDLVQTRGFEQWSTGRQTEKIPYGRLGLTVPAYSGGYNYWEYLNTMIKDSIVGDSKVDMEQDSLGGFRPRTVHSMW